MTQPHAPAKIAVAGAVLAALVGVMAGVWAKPGPAVAHPLLGPRQELGTDDLGKSQPAIGTPPAS